MNVQLRKKRRLFGLAAVLALIGGLFVAAPKAVQAAPLAPPPIETIAPEAGLTKVWHRHHHHHHHGWHRRHHHHHGWHHHHRRHWGHHHHHRHWGHHHHHRRHHHW